MKMKTIFRYFYVLALVLWGGALAAQTMPQDNWRSNQHQFSAPDPTVTLSSIAIGTGGVYVGFIGPATNSIGQFQENGVFIRQFGTFGGIRGIACDSTGNVYVLDAGDATVKVFDQDGSPLRQWGSAGTNDGHFNLTVNDATTAITVDTNDQIYVCDPGNSRVQVFDKLGNFLRKWGTVGNLPSQFPANGPVSIAACFNGRIYVLSGSSSQRLTIFDSFGNYLRTSGSASSSVLSTSPDGLVLSTQTTYYGGNPTWFVAYDADDQSVGSAGLGFNSVYYVFFPRSAAFNKRGDIYAIHRTGDYYNNYGDAVQITEREYSSVQNPLTPPALPMPMVFNVSQRTNTASLDVDFRITDADSTNVSATALAFINGGNMLSAVVPMSTFMENTATNLGANTPANTNLHFTWNMGADWSIDYSQVQVEVLAHDGRNLMGFHWITVPTDGTNAAFQASSAAVPESELLSVWYWLIATHTPGMTFANGTVTGVGGAYDGQLLASSDPNTGSSTTVTGRAFAYSQMGVRAITPAEIARANAGNYGFTPEWPNGPVTSHWVVKLPERCVCCKGINQTRPNVKATRASWTAAGSEAPRRFSPARWLAFIPWFSFRTKAVSPLRSATAVQNLLWFALTLAFITTAHAQNVQFIQTSDPAGIVNQTTYPALGDSASTVTAPPSTGGYAFCYWTLNGVRYNDLLGVALNPVPFTVTAPMAAVAHYLPASQDSNGSGLPDAFKLQYFGTLDITSNSIPVPDGYTVGQKLNYGWNPAAFHQIEAGGISRKRGNLLVVVPGYVGPRENLGGISRRRSATTTVILNNAYARLNVVSAPAGILGSSQVVLKGSTVNLPVAPTGSYGYNFTGWLTNGVRVDSPAQNQPIPIAINQDTTVVARYILSTADTFGVGIPDWMEWFYFDQIGYGLGDDPVGDGIPLGVKIFRGYSLAVPHELATGGISRRRSATTTVILNNNYVQLNAVSDPAGIVASSQVVLKNSTVNLPVVSGNIYGYNFTGWLTNGVRVDRPTQYQPIPISISQNTVVTARYILSSADALGVGIPDWVEWFNFNQIGYTLDSDPDGDGLPLGLEIFRGYPLDAFNQLDIGGISRRRSVLTAVNYFAVPPPGAVTGPASQIANVSAKLNGTVNPNSLPTSAHFEYGLTNLSENATVTQLAGSGTNALPFSQSIIGLIPGNTYHFRVVSASKSGTSYGNDQTFITDTLPLAVQAVTQTNGTIVFTWSSRIGNVYQLQYKTDLSSTNWIDLGGPITATDVSVSVSDVIGSDAQRFYRIELLP
jgi:hypothetical protein